MTPDREYALVEVPEQVLRQVWAKREMHKMRGDSISAFRWDQVLEAEVQAALSNPQQWLDDNELAGELLADEVRFFGRDTLYNAVARLSQPENAGGKAWKVHWLVHAQAGCPVVGCDARFAVHLEGERFRCPVCGAYLLPQELRRGLQLVVVRGPHWKRAE